MQELFSGSFPGDPNPYQPASLFLVNFQGKKQYRPPTTNDKAKGSCSFLALSTMAVDMALTPSINRDVTGSSFPMDKIKTH